MPVDSATILIADDDPLIRAVYKAALEQQGHSVLVAEDGARALAIVEHRKVDFVLLDILMPCKEGLETLIELKKGFPHLKVFVMSGGGSQKRADFLSVATKFGADAVLRKPFQPQALFDLMADHTTEARQQRA
jgi:CheY-like chemotaxis protein